MVFDITHQLQRPSLVNVHAVSPYLALKIATLYHATGDILNHSAVGIQTPALEKQTIMR